MFSGAWRRAAAAAPKQQTLRRLLSEHYRDKMGERLSGWSIWLQKRLILLRGFMVKSRLVNIPGVGATKWTVSEAAGHGAFVALALSYSEKDVWNLRAYACSGILLNLVFQYYRAVPLWIPLRWNLVFLGINSIMFAIQAKESNDAEYIPNEMKSLYYAVFKPLSMSKVEFSRLVDKSSVVRLAPGTKLVDKNGSRDVLYLVQRGSLDVIDGENVKIASIGAAQLVGERQWKNRAMEQQQQQQQQQANSMDETDDGGANENVATASEPAKAAATQPRGSRDVVARTECVLLAWKFDELDEMLSQDDGVALAFERLMSSDLQRKVLASNTQQSKYRYVLKGALLDGAVDEARRQLLKQYREEHSVSEAEHAEVLREIGWTLQRFNADAAVEVPPSVVPAASAQRPRAAAAAQPLSDNRALS